MLKEYPKFTAAAVQIAPVYHDKPVYFDMPATLDNAVKAIKEAASNGATLVVFPELHIPGYCHFALELDAGARSTRASGPSTCATGSRCPARRPTSSAAPPGRTT